MTPWPLATMIVSPIAAKFVEKHNPGITAAAGMGLYAIGITMMLLLPHSGVSELNIAWRMALCGIGFGLFQTPNNIVMVIATPLKRTGGAGGMQSPARLVGQTVGATLVTLIFAISMPKISVQTCLCVALAMAIITGILSMTRASKLKADTHTAP